MTEGDDELVRRTVGADLAAFELRVRRYERSVRSVARAFIADMHVSEDSTQEIFVAAFRSIATLRERDRFGPWLMQIARRVAGNMRQQQVRTPISCEFDEPESRYNPVVNARSQVLLSLIERLPEQERLVVTMRYFDGHRTQEIADVTGIPLGTATFSMTQSVVKRLPSGETSPVEIQRRLSVRADGRIRIEWPVGQQVSVTSPDDFVTLETDATNRTATRRYLYETENRQDIVATLRSLHQTVEAVRIETKEIGSIQCPGFRIEEPDSTLLVWVDPKTRLPVSAERSYTKAITALDRDVVSVTERYDDMKFDVPLADELFSVTPPDGYVVTTVGTPPADRRELFSMPLVVTPQVGVGPLKFGASRAEILRMLGKPDSETISIPIFPVDDKITNVGGKERPPGASLVVLTKLHILNYRALGLSLTVEAAEGLRGIQCLGQDSLGASGRTFRGATDKEIRIGSPAEDVLKAYGQPDENPSNSEQKHGNLEYRELHLEFAMTEKQTVRLINLSDSYEHQLRFEWRVPKE